MEKGKKVVAIDDIASITKFIKVVLSRANYQVFTANNPHEGYNIILEVKPDLVISDVNMPELSGIDIFNRVKSNPELSHIPFIFMTGTSDRDEMKNVDYPAWLNKPFSDIELINTVEEVLITLNGAQKGKKENFTFP